MNYCSICGSETGEGHDHECGRDPISPTTGSPTGPFLEDSTGGHVDNLGTWKRIRERKDHEAPFQEREADG